MIVELTLRNLALVEEVRVPLKPGLNLLTGETGSGKSIIIDGMNLVLGERASADVIREGSDQAFAEAAFDLSGRPQLLEELEVMGCGCSEGVLVLGRELNRGGRTLCRVNGRIVSLAQLKELGDRLVEVHGQHEHQTILRAERQRDLLDAFGGAALRALRDQVQAAHTRWSRAVAALRVFETAAAADQRELDFWRFQLDEIKAAKPGIDEEEALQQERRRWLHAERLARAVESVHAFDGEEASVLHGISLALERFRGLEGIDPELDQMLAILTDVRIQLQDLAVGARDYASRLQFEPGRLEAIEVRLHQFERLKSKYGGSLGAVLETASALRERLEAVDLQDDRLDGLRHEASESTHEVARLAGDLSEQRAAAARRLERAMTQELSSLNMPRARFQVVLTREPHPDGLSLDGEPVRCGPEGVDQVSFQLAANPREPILPLNRAASGGELSRVMLALKAILAEVDNTPTLILDEIDTGIGGETAHRVSEKMQELGRYKQVICVTHLASIAARANHHLVVSKTLRRGRHVTSARPLAASERVDEVARLIAGERLTPAARASARELLSRR